MRTTATLVLVLAMLGFGAPLEAQTSTVRQAPKALITANPYVGTPISSYDVRVNSYSPIGALNQYTTSGGQIRAQDGQYLGTLNANRYDPNSVANPYGRYGSRYSPTSINNPYSPYGSPYSPLSARNPYTSTPPTVTYPSATYTPPATYKPPCYYNCK